MARTVRTKVYKFNELSDESKEKAIEWYRSGGNIDGDFDWECLQDDAKAVGLKIISLDDHRPNKGEFISSAEDTAQKIAINHGEIAETYKTATQYLKDRGALVAKYSDGIEKNKVAEDNEYEFDKECDDLDIEFLHDILEDYRIISNKSEEYRNSDECIIETIIANEYEFTQDGRRF
jgi:hypothetical protein